MSKKTLLVIVIISLAFNSAFFGVFIYRRVLLHNRHLQDPRFHHIPPQCRERFLEDRESMLPLKVEFELSKKRFMRTLMNEEFDRELLEKKLKETIDRQVRMEHEMGQLLIKLRSEMTPEESQGFFQPEHQRFKRPFMKKIRKIRGVSKNEENK